MLLDSIQLTRPDILWIMTGMVAFLFLMLFLGFATYLRQRRIERENYYRFELRRKAIEAGVSGETLLEMQRQEELIVQRRGRESHKFTGIVATVAGVALVALAKPTGHRDTLAIAFLPLIVGVGFLVYAQWFAPRGDRGGGPNPR